MHFFNTHFRLEKFPMDTVIFTGRVPFVGDADSRAWLAAIEKALEAGDVSLAWALLFEPQLPDAGDLAALRNEVVRRGCGD